MTVFPPEDICGFLHLSVGEWLTLRSLLDPNAEAPRVVLEPAANADSQSWHESDRGDLRVTLLEATGAEDWGGWSISLPDQSTHTLVFQKDGTVLMNTLPGRWHLDKDGSLELELLEGSRTVKERIWYSKPNLRLRCTYECLDGQPGRASFSSEIRRLNRPSETSAPSNS